MLKQLLVASRPVSWVNTAYPFAAAYLVTTGGIDATWVVGTVFFLVPYNLAMYGINDVFDYESDLRNPRKGGAHGAVLDPRAHRVTLWAAALSCLPFVVYLGVVGSPASWVVLALSLFFVVEYSAPPWRLKEVPIADSATSSIHFFSPAVYALVLAGATWTPGLVALICAFALWGVASHALGAVQDIVADREARISSIATARGARWTVRFAIACYAAAAVLVLATAWPGPLAAVVAVMYIVNAWAYRNVADHQATAVTAAWRRFLWLNQIAGAAVTVLLIWYVAIG
ncbi:prenyltransferase [Microbacterium fluvii]|uniref:Prenyltransferase n=1 Tax=Microbacterium fluvii TaxID=415215 RepID=A0ABW2HDM4_9MICO|nr:prenyltransferase [Microbacterium fluvii]MCU4672228.1 prenyltransferase [Microbacterium fluvii]